MMTRQSKRRVRVTRDTILFVIGVSGIIYETLSNGIERPTLLLIFAGMAGLTGFMRNDEKHQGDDEK